MKGIVHEKHEKSIKSLYVHCMESFFVSFVDCIFSKIGYLMQDQIYSRKNF